MKKIVLFFALLTLTTGAWAQKSNIRNVRSYLDDNNYRKAIPEIDAAVAHEDTKASSEAWYLRGFSYYLQAKDSSGRTPNSLDESARSITKSLELTPNFKGDNALVYNLCILIFNDGLSHYNNAEYSKAYDRFMQVSDLYKKTKVYGDLPALKDLAVNAKTNAALCAINAKKDKEALQLFMEIKDEQSPKDSNTYYSLIEILERQQNNDQLIAIINEGLKTWPNNKMLRTSELNYYINTGRTNELLPKLEAAAAMDPENPELQFRIGNIYEGMSFPKDANKKLTARPANADEYFAKAEAAYKKALDKSPNNAEFNYNFGVLYYQYAVTYNTQAMGITGTSAADGKKVDELIAKRDAKFTLALPYIEKAFSILDANTSKLSDDDKVTYKNSIIGLMEIYSRLNNTAKNNEMKKKFEAARQL